MPAGRGESGCYPLTGTGDKFQKTSNSKLIRLKNKYLQLWHQKIFFSQKMMFIFGPVFKINP
jgi:hypothetical protein